MWRTLNRTLAVGLTLLLLLAGSASARVSVPDWMRQLAAEPLGAYPPETKAIVLLDQTDYTITAPGEYLEHSRWVVRILRPEGRDEGNLAVSIGRGEKLNDIHAWTLDSEGHEYELKQKDFTQKGFPSFELYSDIYTLTATAPAAGPGSVIAFEWDVRRHDYVNQLDLFVQEPNPVHEVRFGLTLPAGWEFRDSWAGTAPVKPTQTSSNSWEWVAHDLPGIQTETDMPPKYVLMGRVAIAYFSPEGAQNQASWKGLGQWYLGLTTGRRDPSPEITQEVTTLIAGKNTFDAKLRAMTQFLQSQIRYVEIQIGIGGYQPHFASEIFQYRYGDCKDKATLLSSMLQVAGIQSDYVLIDTDRGFVKPGLPSAWFDHAILAIELPRDVSSSAYQSVVTAKSGQRYLIFDPTDQYTPVGSLRSELQDSYALLVTSAGGELIRTPLLPPDSNMITRKGDFVLNSDGTLSGGISEARSGDFAMKKRYQLQDTDERERDNNLNRWLGRFLQGFSMDALNFQQENNIQQNLLISYKLGMPAYGQLRGPLMLVRLCVLGDKGSFVEHKPRHYPLELDGTTLQTDDYEIQLPKDYQVDELPDPVKLDVGFAAYQSKIEAENGKLHYWREYQVRDADVPPEKFPDWVNLQGRIGADENAAVILKRVQ